MPDAEQEYRRKPEFFEHRMARFPDLVFVCPRCKTSLVFSPPNSTPACHRCSNEEPGRVYIALDVLESILLDMYRKTTSVEVAEDIREWVQKRAAEMGQPLQPADAK